MGSPAVKPPKISEFPPALRKHVKKIIDYIEQTHVEEVKINEVAGAGSHTVEFLRGDTGLIINIKLAVVDCTPPA